MDVTAPTLADIREVVVFALAGQRYALPIGAVQEIQQIVAMSEVPGSTPGLVGMVDLRGEVIPVVDARRLLGMEPAPYALDTPMIIARAGSALIALVVDEVDDVVTLAPGCVQAPGEVYEFADRLLGVCRLEGGFVFLLDPVRLLGHAEAACAPTQPHAAPKPKPKKRTRKKAT